MTVQKKQSKQWEITKSRPWRSTAITTNTPPSAMRYLEITKKYTEKKG